MALTACQVPNTLALVFAPESRDQIGHLVDTLAAYGAKATFFLHHEPRRDSGGDPRTATLGQNGHQIGLRIRPEALGLDQPSDPLPLPKYVIAADDDCGTNTPCQTSLVDAGFRVVVPPASPDTVLDTQPNADQLLRVDSDDMDALDRLLHDAVESGLRLVTVGECIGDPVDNWYSTTTTVPAMRIQRRDEIPKPPTTTTPVRRAVFAQAAAHLAGHHTEFTIVLALWVLALTSLTWAVRTHARIEKAREEGRVRPGSKLA